MMRKQTTGLFSRFLLLVAIAGFGFAGCSDDNPSGNDGTGNDKVTVTKPGQGSVYEYEEYDTEGGAKVDGSEQDVTMTVVETGVSYEGKADVFKVQEEYKSGEKSDLYVRFESNNDMTLLFSDEAIDAVESFWITIPFGSGTTQSKVLLNEVEENGQGGFDTLMLKWETSYVGKETVQYNGSDMEVWVGKIIISGKFPFPPFGNVELNGVSMVEFAPSLGFIYRTEDESDGEGSVRTLMSHTLK